MFFFNTFYGRIARCGCQASSLSLNPDAYLHHSNRHHYSTQAFMVNKKRKHRVRVALSDLEQPEICLGTLLCGKAGSAGEEDDRKKMKKKKQSRSDLSVSGGPSHSPPPFHENDDDDPWGRAGNILTQLEQKYSVHGGIRPSPGRGDGALGEEGKPRPRKKRTRQDDMYELDDDFIDDSALFEMFEKQHEAQSVVTKYTGFFVNKGDLEVVGHKEGSRASLGAGPGKERKKKARKSGGERDAPGKKKRTGEGEEGSGGVGEGGGHAKGRKTKGGKAGPGGDEGSVVSTGSTKTAGEGGGSTSSKQNQKIKGREMEGAALREFKGRVAEWGRGGEGETAKPSDSGTAESIPSTWLPLEDDGDSALSVKKDSEGLPPSLRGAALALDVVMRRKGGEPRWRSAQPGEQGMSSSYIDTVLQTAFPLKMGKEQNVESIRKAWRKGLAEAALARVKELDTSIEKSLNDFGRHYELKKERLLKRSSAGGKTEGKVGEGHEEGKEQGKEIQGMPPPRSVALDAKLKHYIVTLLSSLKERCNIQALYAGQGIEGGADQVEAGGLLPRVAPRYEEEERRTLLELANTWPNGEMKIPRLRRALNAYKGKQNLLQSVAGVAGGGPGREEKVEAAGGTSSTSSKASHGKDRKVGKGLIDKIMTGKKVKKTAEVRRQVGPRKGSFVNLQVRPYDPKDFEVDAKKV